MTTDARHGKRTIDLELVPAAGFSPDDHAVCPFTDCGAVMSFDADRGELACPDCRVTASDAAEAVWAEVVAS